MNCVNYLTQRQAFHDFLRLESPIRILLYRGQSGSGKTTLLNTCLHEKPIDILSTPFTFREGTNLNIGEVLYRIGEQIGWNFMTSFNQEVQHLYTPVSVQVHGISQIGSHNSIDMVLQSETISRRKDNQENLTHAWFMDIHRRAKMILIVFDVYENAPIEMQDWISGPFLKRLVDEPYMRVLIAGRTIPDPNNIEWGNWCQCHDLYGIRDVQHWKPIIKEMKHYIPYGEHDSDVWLEGVCHALKGNPSEIIKIIEGLPLMGTQ
jgi:GTPase SAR1 family protein